MSAAPTRPVDLGGAVPSDPAGYTPAWMTRALARHHPGAVVSAVKVDEVDVGTTTRIRLRLEYSAGDGPATVLLKAQGAFSHRVIVAMFGVLTSEARFYAGSSAVQINTPVTYATGVKRRSCQSVVVMEDITASGGRPNYAVDPLEPAAVASGLRGLAHLHAHFWETDPRTELGRVPGWVNVPRYTGVIAAGCGTGVRRLPRHGVDLSGGLMSAKRLTALWVKSQIRTFNSRPRTVLHGDAHVGNSYTLSSGEVGFYDWQVIERGSWVHDVGYFLVSSLDVEDRRKHDRELIETYLETLRADGIPAPTFEAAWAAYRRTPAYGLPSWVTTLGIAGLQRDENTVMTIKRFAAAFEDLSTGDVI